MLRRRGRSASEWRRIRRCFAVAFTLLVSTLLVLWAGAPVGQTYALLARGAFGSVFALTETLTRATPLILTGLAAAVAFRARLFNIGAEGQLYAGAIAAVAVGVTPSEVRYLTIAYSRVKRAGCCHLVF